MQACKMNSHSTAMHTKVLPRHHGPIAVVICPGSGPGPLTRHGPGPASAARIGGGQRTCFQQKCSEGGLAKRSSSISSSSFGVVPGDPGHLFAPRPCFTAKSKLWTGWSFRVAGLGPDLQELIFVQPSASNANSANELSGAPRANFPSDGSDG